MLARFFFFKLEQKIFTGTGNSERDSFHRNRSGTVFRLSQEQERDSFLEQHFDSESAGFVELFKLEQIFSSVS